MIVRLMNEKDIEENNIELKQLIECCISSTYRIDNLHAFSEKKIKDLQFHISNNTAYPLIALENDKVIGFLWGYPTKGVKGTAFHLAYISVLPEARGRGVAKELIKYAEMVARDHGFNQMELIVNTENKGALSLYKKMNFEAERMILSKALQESR